MELKPHTNSEIVNPMLRPLTIWTEGIHDVKFLSDIISQMHPDAVLSMAKGAKIAIFFSEEVDIKIQETGGKSAFVTEPGYQNLAQKLKDEESQGRRNVFILDADDGYVEQRKQVKRSDGRELYRKFCVSLAPECGA